MLRIEKRAEWGAREPRNRRYDVDPRGVVIHWPGADAEFRAMTHGAHERMLRQWQAMHMDGQGQNDIGYGSLICPCSPPVWMEGRTETRRPMVRVGSNGTAQSNHRYTSVQLMLGTTERIDDEMIRAAGEAIARLRLAGWGRQVLGHRDTNQTTCPGDSIYGALGAIRAVADEWTPGGQPPQPPPMHREQEMIIIQKEGTTGQYLAGVNGVAGIANPADLKQIRQALADPQHTAVVSRETFDRIVAAGG